MTLVLQIFSRLLFCFVCILNFFTLLLIRTRDSRYIQERASGGHNTRDARDDVPSGVCRRRRHPRRVLYSRPVLVAPASRLSRDSPRAAHSLNESTELLCHTHPRVLAMTMILNVMWSGRNYTAPLFRCYANILHIYKVLIKCATLIILAFHSIVGVGN